MPRPLPTVPLEEPRTAYQVTARHHVATTDTAATMDLMASHDTCPCDTCLDWRVEQSRSVGDHIASLLQMVLTDLDIDPTDEHVRAVCARRLRETGAPE